MIDGFKLRVTAAELSQHCKQRAAYHANRAEEKEQELPSLRDAMTRLKQTAPPKALSGMSGKGAYNLDPDDPVKDLESDIRDHRNQALVFAFFAEHLFDEDYTLREEDLVRLQILKR